MRSSRERRGYALAVVAIAAISSLAFNASASSEYHGAKYVDAARWMLVTQGGLLACDAMGELAPRLGSALGGWLPSRGTIPTELPAHTKTRRAGLWHLGGGLRDQHRGDEHGHLVSGFAAASLF